MWLQAAEKYVLGELAEELCEAYEEHYFDCQECATDVIATAAFVDVSHFAEKIVSANSNCNREITSP